MTTKPEPVTSRLCFALGVVAAGVLLLGLAEAFLRLAPPRDFDAYRGEDSPRAGPYRPDDDFGVAYQSWEALWRENAERLSPFLPFAAHTGEPRLWAFFGNSFVQAPGMLADHARQAVRDRRIFNLGKNELLFVRMAQVKTLLELGMQPEHLFFELMPVDVAPLGEQPLATVQITSRGALTYRPRLPSGPLGHLVSQSELASTAWFRAGRHRGNPDFTSRHLHEAVPELLRRDLEHLFAALARLTQPRHVPTTVLLIPGHPQVVRGAGFGFQDTLGRTLAAQGHDVFDPRDAFLRHPDPASLYLPDKHLSDAGNRLLLAELLEHIRGRDTLAHEDAQAARP